MSKENKNNVVPFSAVLSVAEAESFATVAEGDNVASGGFLLEEDQLKAVNKKLSDNETVVSTLTARINELEAQDATGLKEQLATAQQEAKDAKEQLAAANASLKEAQEQLASFKDASGDFFNGAPKEGDDKGSAHGNAAAYDPTNNPVYQEAAAEVSIAQEEEAK